jgi:hypothetical protein
MKMTGTVIRHHIFSVLPYSLVEVSLLPSSSTVKMEAAGSSKLSANFCQSVCCHIAGGSILHSHC